MRAKEVKAWFDAMPRAVTPFDRLVVAHIVRVLELVQGNQEQNIEGRDAFPTPAAWEMFASSLAVLKARAAKEIEERAIQATVASLIEIQSTQQTPAPAHVPVWDSAPAT